MSDAAADIEEKLSALIDDKGFAVINDQMARFNVFEAMGAVRSEIRHSNFLAFLLSPTRPHGLGSEPLLRVLRAVLANTPPEQRPLRPLELLVGDLDGAIVYRERDNMDLLIEIKALDLVVLFENKIGAKAGEGQLANYKAVLAARYPNARRLLVFLTPDGTPPDEDGYAIFDFAELANVFDGLLDQCQTGTALIISHYTEMLRRHIVSDQKLEDLARQLYQRHKEAFDFVFERRPTPESMMDFVRELMSSTPGLVEDRHGASIFRFAPQSWSGASPLNTTSPTVWTKTGRTVVFEVFSTQTGRVGLRLVIGPADRAIRERLYNGARDRPDVFKGLVKPMGKVYSSIYSRNLLTDAEARNMEPEQKAEVLKAVWQAFIADDLPAIEKATLEISGAASPA